MGVVQINKIVNSILGQALGREDIAANNASFVSDGDLVFSSDKNTEAVYQTLVDRIGLTVSSVRAYEGVTSPMRRFPMEWGVIMQKIDFPMPKAVENPAWLGVSDTSDGGVLAPANTDKPIQRLFSSIGTWEYDGTIWNNQLRHAFTSADAMMAFINAIFTAVYNSQQTTYENLDAVCRAAFIAKISTNKGRVIKLLSNYNTMAGTSLTFANCMNNPDFLRYCAMTISLYSKRMEKMSRTFNDGSIDRHTPRDLQSLVLLADFAEAFSYVAKSQTFHDEILSMPMYESVPYWQGSGQAGNLGIWSLAKTSQIEVETDGSGDATLITGVVGVLADYEAYGSVIKEMSTSSMYNPRRKFTNYFYQSETGYFNDVTENGIIFVIQ